MSGPGEFDPDDGAGLQDPERLYGPLRHACPVAHSNAYGGFWAVTRYRDVERVMTDPATFTSSQGIIIPKNPASGRRPPLHYDPPEHTDFRKAMSPVFRKDRMRRLLPVMQHAAEALLAPAGPTVELYGDYCSPLTARVVCALLHLPEQLVDDLVLHIDRFEDAQRRRDVAVVEAENQLLYGLCRRAVAARVAEPLPPQEDVVSALLTVVVDGVPISHELVAGSLRQIVVAGHGAPALVLASAALHLAQDDQLQIRARSEPDCLADLVDEMLRLHTPNVGFARTTTQPVQLGGRTIGAGQPVAVVLPAANRDPEIFDDPEAVVFHRSERHLAFGVGPHVCPGSVPGRDEVAVGLAVLLQHSTWLQIDGEVAYSPWPTSGPTRLPLRLDAAVPEHVAVRAERPDPSPRPPTPEPSTAD